MFNAVAQVAADAPPWTHFIDTQSGMLPKLRSRTMSRLFLDHESFATPPFLLGHLPEVNGLRTGLALRDDSNRLQPFQLAGHASSSSPNFGRCLTLPSQGFDNRFEFRRIGGLERPEEFQPQPDQGAGPRLSMMVILPFADFVVAGPDMAAPTPAAGPANVLFAFGSSLAHGDQASHFLSSFTCGKTSPAARRWLSSARR